MTQLLAVGRTARPAFIVLAPVCVFLGTTAAEAQCVSINHLHVILATLGAILAHISVNTLNEFHDFSSGLDLNTRRTPFSGGSGVLPKHPELAGTVRSVGIVCALMTVAIGVFFIDTVGWGIVPVGLAGVGLILAYSRFLTKHPWVCLFAPGLGFGMLTVVGTAYILDGRFHALPIVAGLVPFFLCNNLLLLNQFPDIDADRQAGRRVFPIVYGVAASARVYAVFLLGSNLTIIGGVLKGLFPPVALGGLVFLLPGLVSLHGAVTRGRAVADYPIYLACNAAAAVIAPLVLGFVLAYGAHEPVSAGSPGSAWLANKRAAIVGAGFVRPLDP